jgi:aspartyl-tRNA(Asn)/glutamyl-tRNA(Gln) amidotransferase subunit B
MRTKEGSSDYRYFPEPDLVPVAPTAEMRAAVRGAMPELPAARRERLVHDWGVSEPDARVLVATPGLAEYAEVAVSELDGGAAKDVVNWCIGDVLAYLNESGLAPAVLPLPPDGLAELIGLLAAGTLSRGQAKDVLAECLTEPKRPKQVVAERGLTQVSDEGELGAVIDGILAERSADVAEYRAGDDKVRKKKRGFFMGEAMKATRGQGNPQLLNRLLDEKLAGPGA